MVASQLIPENAAIGRNGGLRNFVNRGCSSGCGRCSLRNLLQGVARLTTLLTLIWSWVKSSESAPAQSLAGPRRSDELSPLSPIAVYAKLCGARSEGW